MCKDGNEIYHSVYLALASLVDFCNSNMALRSDSLNGRDRRGKQLVIHVDCLDLNNNITTFHSV